ncbi:septal ring lytic transglycosylase RlpA family protein [Marinactinospora thermotolerans]|uniref:Probable endolytic peptidoglycan transglycosylase RlpA n=1 Tax=Marinactinospora thermotolerans DSM 45154 TaxID=1122192 RepID=A0A1T4PU39_9ACTN|nr:septal ring lytic transglycosylase RlpA family protein [Marinactinospora thermotolerans]SJZ95082.1 rare lipoprotein A [Marinactinospora thermotolerans DSM 45154]
MGTHRPSRPAPFTKSKRLIVATAAAGAVVVAGATAGAAALDAPATTPEAAAIPQARTAALAPLSEGAVSSPDPQTAERLRAEATDQAVQAFNGSARQAEKEEPRAETQDTGETSSTGTSGDSGASPAPTGQGGSCEASMYSDPQPTASGETFDPSAMTAAHKTLPMHTMVEVTNPANGKSVTVRINDRGPYIDGRCLDLSTAAFETIASASQGVVDVEWQVVE